MHEPVLLRDVPTMADWWEAGGGIGLDRAEKLGVGGTLQELGLAGLRGRGGAGFPTARKWRSIGQARPETGDRYVVVNAAEGEPGTFKDRALIRANPYQLIEGAAIAAVTVGATKAYIGLKKTFRTEIDRLERALTEMEAEGLTAGVDFELVAGPDHYLLGEETGLLQVIEGEEPLPRWAPPYQHGLFATGPQAGWSSAPKRDAEPTEPVQPHAGQQRGDVVQRPAHPGPRPGVVPVDGDRGVARPDRLHGRRRRRDADRGRSRDGHAAHRAHRDPRRGLGRGALREGRPVRLRQPGADRGRPGRPDQLRGAARRRRRPGLGRVHRLRRPDEHGRGGPPGQQLPLRRELRAVLALQARARGTSPSASTASPGPGATKATSRPSGPACSP